MENKFPETLKSLLRQKGTTHAELAKVLGLQTNNISGYVNGRVRPNIDSLIKIASYFSVSLDYLITGQNPENKILSTELGLSEGTLWTLKEFAAKKHGEKFDGLSPYIDKLLSDTDFLETYFKAVCELENSAILYPLIEKAMKSQGVEFAPNLPELYIESVERDAVEKISTYFRRLFYRENTMRKEHRDNTND